MNSHFSVATFGEESHKGSSRTDIAACHVSFDLCYSLGWWAVSQPLRLFTGREEDFYYAAVFYLCLHYYNISWLKNCLVHSSVVYKVLKKLHRLRQNTHPLCGDSSQRKDKRAVYPRASQRQLQLSWSRHNIASVQAFFCLDLFDYHHFWHYFSFQRSLSCSSKKEKKNLEMTHLVFNQHL